MMKKILLLILLLVAIACSKKDYSNMPEKGYNRVYPLLIVNGGDPNNDLSTGSVSRYNQSSNSYRTDIYGGDKNLGMGGTPSFACKWIDTLYVVSKENRSGNVLSAYNNLTGTFLWGYKTEEGVKGSAFAVVNNKSAILTTYGGGAILIDMVSRTAKGNLKGTSQNTGDLFIGDKNLFLIDNQSRLLAYPLEELATASPVDLGEAVGGFTPDKEGNLWAYNNLSTYDPETNTVVTANTTELLKINLQTLEVTRNEIKFPIMPALFTYHSGLMTASNSENAIYFIQSSEVKNSVIYKYDTITGLIQNFYTLDSNSTLINLLYNPSNNTISIISKKTDVQEEHFIMTIDATNGKLKQSFKYPRNNLEASNPSYMLLN